MFKIIESNPPFSPIPARFPEFKTIEELITRNVERDDELLFFLSEQVWKQDIGEHIGWGKSIPQNKVEQGGILLGNVYFDKENKKTFAVVEKALAGSSAKGSPAYLRMDHQTWKEMLDEADQYLDNESNQLRVIGWYHTHPGGLNVFMSGTDMDTQKTFFANFWQFAIVLNPHKRIWRAFAGASATECIGNVIDQESFDLWKSIEDPNLAA